jgi:CRP-like cAMP-binding protein
MSDVRKFRKGEILVREGDTDTLAYIILSGSVEIFRAIKGKKVVLATLGSGNIIGEMELITERPRTVSVAALEDTIVSAVNRDTFESMILEDPDCVIQLLNQVYHRMNHLNHIFMELYEKVGVNVVDATPRELHLKALTREAENALGKRRVQISKTPFFIGRANNQTIFESRDLNLIDHEPYEISRNHCVIALVQDQYQIIDSNSTLGTDVDGIRIGKKQAKKSIPLESGQHRIVLGGAESAYVFELQVP